VTVSPLPFGRQLVSVLKVGTDTGGVSDLKESRKSRNCAEAYSAYAAQEIPRADAEIAEKGRFETETNSLFHITASFAKR
jgi:hypothetical protein